jgi:predicted nuclease with TOPRIM domain
MSHEELVKRLRGMDGDSMSIKTLDEAADRIEELTKENARLERVVKDISDEADLAEQEACMLENDFIKAEKGIEELEAKLAECEARLGKAVEALRYYAVEAMPWEADDSLIARCALAEIEGEKGSGQ